MALNLVKQAYRKALSADAAEDAQASNPPSSLAETRGAMAVDLVNKAVGLVQTIEDRAAKTVARAHELAERAAEQLTAMQGALAEANARTDEAEERARQAEAHIADLEARLDAAEERTKSAEARAIEAEHIVIRVENALQCQLLEKLQPSASRMPAAA